MVVVMGEIEIWGGIEIYYLEQMSEFTHSLVI